MRSLLCWLISLATVSLSASEDVHALFAHPPRAARLQTFWHWASDCVTREGVIRDLDAMADAGIMTAHIYCPHVGAGGLPYNVPMMSEKWLDLFTFTIAEAKKRDITLGFHNCPGWSSSGGPWIAPEDSMKEVVVSDRAFESDGVSPVPSLPQPQAKKDFYRDIAVWAIPLAPLPRLVSGPKAVELHCNARKGRMDELVYEYAEPTLPEALVFTLDDRRFCATVRIFGEDGKGGWKKYAQRGWNHWDDPFTRHILTIPRTRKPSRRFKVTFEEAPDFWPWMGERVLKPTELMLTNGFAAEDPARAIKAPKILPKGCWWLARVGYTTTGKGPAPATLSGLECDKFSKVALDKHWAAMPAKILSLPGAKGTIEYCDIDSFEAGKQNWSECVPEAYAAKIGHSLGVEVLQLAGYRIGTAEESRALGQRFTALFGDLIAENYYDRFAELCRKNGVKSMVETYGSVCPRERAARDIDVPQCEFWLGPPSADPMNPRRMDEVCAANGKPILACEAFTTGQKAGRWQATPHELRVALDRQGWIEGVNQIQYHSYLHQPALNVKPGLSLHRHGTQLNVNTTWWSEMKKTFSAYVARGQALLQAGVRDRSVDRAGRPAFDGPVELRALKRNLSNGETIYFVVNTTNRACSASVAFAHAEGTFPELFDAAKGTVSPAEAKEGRVSLELPAEGSVFVVFTRRRGVPVTMKKENVLATLTDGWRITSFDGPGAPKPFEIDTLTSWTESSDPQLKYFSGRAVYERRVKSLEFGVKSCGEERMILDLGDVREMANVWVNDTYVGCVWESPYKIDITAALTTNNQQLTASSTLRVEVINTWPNRMIGDAVARKNGAKEERDPVTKLPLWVKSGKSDSGTGIYTWSNFDWGWKAEDELKPSGLLGPVRLISVAR